MTAIGGRHAHLVPKQTTTATRGSSSQKHVYVTGPLGDEAIYLKWVAVTGALE